MGILDSLIRHREKKRLHESQTRTFVRQNDRDSFRFYEKGRSVTVEAEMLVGEFDRVLYRQNVLHWDDNGQPLTDEEHEKVYKMIGAYFNAKGIRWKIG